MAEATRPPERSDLLQVCAELNRLGAKYIVIGGLAMNELGLVRVTEDIDLLLEPSPENQQRVREALRVLPERAIDELGPEEDLREWVVVRVNDEITVDLMTAACGVVYAEGKDDLITRTIGGVEIPFASRNLMIRLKQGNREKDRIDLEYLLRSGSSQTS
jgi:Nucleotidyl transferase AbiEii toxin, Type IV TA system